MRWLIYHQETGETLASFTSAWVAEEYLDELEFDDPELRAACLLIEEPGELEARIQEALLA